MIENKIKQIREDLNKYSYNYYVLDNPLISDFEYDNLYKELEELEKQYPEFVTPDSPTQRVGGISSGFEEVKHKYRLYSLDNTYNYEELRKWYEKITKEFGNNVELVCELKIDGLAIALTYKNGYFVQRAVTGLWVKKSLKTLKQYGQFL